MTEREVLDIFREYGALLEGHFVLSSGLHSDRYIQCARVLEHPRVAERLGAALAEKFRTTGGTAVIAPALGGILVAHEVARALGVRALFTERQEGAMTLRRGFELAPAEPVLVVEDVITTGLSTRETIACVEHAGGRVLAAGSLVDRSGGSAQLADSSGAPLRRASLATLRVENYSPDACPLCRSGLPAIKPGSRTKPRA